MTTPSPDPRDVKDRRETGYMGIAAAGLIGLVGLGLLVEGASGGGLLLVAIGLAVLVAATAGAVFSWRFGQGA
ncbi:MAG TPA: hypothetical protein VFW92_04065 [Candidatus Limnocylindrales bacterium]|nr:hypothetical protein [Candidatus Limnocylindrales bacterium]